MLRLLLLCPGLSVVINLNVLSALPSLYLSLTPISPPSTLLLFFRFPPVSENAQVGRAVGLILAAAINTTIFYSIVGGNEGGKHTACWVIGCCQAGLFCACLNRVLKKGTELQGILVAG